LRTIFIAQIYFIEIPQKGFTLKYIIQTAEILNTIVRFDIAKSK